MTAAILTIREGEEFFGEWEDFRKDGSRVWIEARVSLIRDAEGRPAGILGVSHDITERKRLEERVRETAKLEAVGNLAGGIGHEFNNLLTVIQGFTQVMLGGLHEHD
jgi:two-component system, cell cycle sensor histidine kinase and response regulator CckA